MGKSSKNTVSKVVDPLVANFIDSASLGDLRAVKKLLKSASLEVDDGECVCV